MAVISGRWAWASAYGGFPTPRINPRRPYPVPVPVVLVPVATRPSDTLETLVGNYEQVFRVAAAGAAPSSVVLKLPCLTPPFTARLPDGSTVGEHLYPLAARAMAQVLSGLEPETLATFLRIEVPDFSPTRVLDGAVAEAARARPELAARVWSGDRARVDFLKFGLADPPGVRNVAAYPSRAAAEGTPGMFDHAVAANTIAA